MENNLKSRLLTPAEIVFVQTNYRKKDNCLFNLLEKSPIIVHPNSEINKKTDLNFEVNSEYLNHLREKNDKYKHYIDNLRSKTPDIKKIKIRNFEYLNHSLIRGKYQLPLPKLPKIERKYIIKSGSEKLFPGKYDIMSVKYKKMNENDIKHRQPKLINNSYFYNLNQIKFRKNTEESKKH